jgi:hypothetical protein
MASVIWDQWHYIRSGDGTEELYALPGDPWEVENRVAGVSQDFLDRFRAQVHVLEQHGLPASAVSTEGGRSKDGAPLDVVVSPSGGSR